MKYEKNLCLNGTMLFVREYADNIERNYSFHWQDTDNKLIVLW